MKSLLTAIVAGILAGATFPSHAETDPTLGVRVDEIHTALNSHFKQGDFSERAVKIKCEAVAQAVCQYSVGKTTRIMATATELKAPAREIIVVFGSEKPNAQASLQALVTYAALITILSPSADKKERGAVISTLLSGLSKENGPSNAELDNVRYTIRVFEGMGVWLIATPAK